MNETVTLGKTEKGSTWMASFCDESPWVCVWEVTEDGYASPGKLLPAFVFHSIAFRLSARALNDFVVSKSLEKQSVFSDKPYDLNPDFIDGPR